MIDLALEHQAAINLLIRQKHPGSAMALVRSVIEAMCKDAWVLAIVTMRIIRRADRRSVDGELGRHSRGHTRVPPLFVILASGRASALCG